MFVRGLTNLTSIERIENEVSNTTLGIVYPELRTKDDTLSMWYIRDVNDFSDAALSIILPRNHIAGASFLILESDVLDSNHIVYSQNNPKTIYLTESKAQHYDITGVTVGRVESILRAYKMTYQKEIECLEEKYIINWDIEQSKQYILKAMREGRIQFNLLQPDMKKDIQKLLSNSSD